MGDFNIDILKYGSNDHVNRFLNEMYSSQFYPKKANNNNYKLSDDNW